MADFILVSRRTLEEYDYVVFKYHFLLGADWNLCCKKLKLDRGEFFHEVYRIQQKLGRTFRELEPHALFPLDQYFNSRTKEPIEISPTFKVETEAAPKIKPVLRFPLKRAAWEQVSLGSTISFWPGFRAWLFFVARMFDSSKVKAFSQPDGGRSASKAQGRRCETGSEGNAEQT
jgi:hypothetical protein